MVISPVRLNHESQSGFNLNHVHNVQKSGRLRWFTVENVQIDTNVDTSGGL